MKKQTKLGKEKRDKDREGYNKFYNLHALISKNVKKQCENCGRTLSGHVSEVAHILPKNVFRSVATNDKNVLYLCSNFVYGSDGCHDKYDSTWVAAKSMPVWNTALNRFKTFKDEITEKDFKILQHFE